MCGAAQPCTVQYALCATGISGSAKVAHNWYCTYTQPDGSLPNAAGIYAFETLANCFAAPNGCNLNSPCEKSISDCQSGVAAPFAFTYSYICPSSIPQGSIANG